MLAHAPTSVATVVIKNVKADTSLNGLYVSGDVSSSNLSGNCLASASDRAGQPNKAGLLKVALLYGVKKHEIHEFKVINYR